MSTFTRLLGRSGAPAEVSTALAHETRRLAEENAKLRNQAGELGRAIAEALRVSHRAAAAGLLPTEVKNALHRLSLLVTPDGGLR